MIDATLRRFRLRSELFSWQAFGIAAGALVLAPIAAETDLFHSYTPYLILRFGLVGFSIYAIILSRSAGGLRKVWQVPYALIALVFLFVAGLEVEEWAIIDVGTAIIILVSSLFLRTEPMGNRVTDPAWRRTFDEALAQVRADFPHQNETTILDKAIRLADHQFTIKVQQHARRRR